ncbi:hypothetical protein HMF7854_10615 [Sphingomonas ginkgonis]|uniref:Right handed beta helix domain-containing protein n=1 Tax=Sphingomonas ginkgonis TaxID=2315330 RepID=A0A3R9WT77_9SPHN|nr:hypothetical protein [Sphingomonas ginkgonis]RST31237.1 hypothetical protein HMF7854_10615 [Sphingomonas ginkgonis]
MVNRRELIEGSVAVAAIGLAAARAPAAPASGLVHRPEAFGARGDGRHNDTAAFHQLSRAVADAGGGTILLARGRTYVVGSQTPRADGSLTGESIIALEGLRRPLAVVGNGARLLAEPGLKFGRFDAAGQRLDLPMPNTEIKGVAWPYQGMIDIRGCHAPVLVSDLVLDGNLPALRIGGQHGDIGWQIPGSGVFLSGNLAGEQLIGITSRHHGQDGIMVNAPAARQGRTRLERVRCFENGRQGLSIIGGHGYDLVDCEFARSARGPVSSPPGAGVDIEAEGEPVRDLHFVRCRFVDNVGIGMVADSGDSADARFDECLFVGTSTWSAWPRKPGFRFNRCTFAGAVVQCHSDRTDPAKAVQFADCLFTDDPKLAGGQPVYLADPKGGTIVDTGGGGSHNLLFRRCRFALTHNGILPWSWNATYEDCTMRQALAQTNHSKGRFLGTTRMDAPNPDIYGSLVLGTLIVNGKMIERGQIGDNDW